MSKALTEIAKRPGRLPAFVTALAILVWLLLVHVVGQLVGNAANAIYNAMSPGTVQGPADLFLVQIISTLLIVIPVSLGIFISLWAIAPISDELTLRFVLTRAALATVCGVVLYEVTQIVWSFFTLLRSAGPLFGYSFPWAGFDGKTFLNNVLGQLFGGISFFFGTVPIVALACVLLWLWLRDHPREYAVAGLIDDV